MLSGMTPHLARSSEGTENALHQISLDHMTPSELDEWEKLMSGDGRHDMRDSNKFWLNKTKGNLLPRNSKEGYRPSLKVGHHDVYLDAHRRHLVE